MEIKTNAQVPCTRTLLAHWINLLSCTAHDDKDWTGLKL